MTTLTSNDNQPTLDHGRMLVPESHGKAALLLFESLLHGLIARSVVSVQEAVEIVETAVEVNEDMATEMGTLDPAIERSLALLYSIHSSLSIDLPMNGAE